jgi:hypothetical protein
MANKINIGGRGDAGSEVGGDGDGHGLDKVKKEGEIKDGDKVDDQEKKKDKDDDKAGEDEDSEDKVKKEGDKKKDEDDDKEDEDSKPTITRGKGFGGKKTLAIVLIFFFANISPVETKLYDVRCSHRRVPSYSDCPIYKSCSHVHAPPLCGIKKFVR